MSCTRERRAANGSDTEVRLIHSATLSPPPAGLGKCTFTEDEKWMALEELCRMRTLEAAVRDLKLKGSSGQPKVRATSRC
jgi:hypothetical protein